MELFRQLDDKWTDRQTNELTELFLKSLSRLKMSILFEIYVLKLGHLVVTLPLLSRWPITITGILWEVFLTICIFIPPLMTVVT